MFPSAYTYNLEGHSGRSDKEAQYKSGGWACCPRLERILPVDKSNEDHDEDVDYDCHVEKMSRVL